jgi:hypothetical protein
VQIANGPQKDCVCGQNQLFVQGDVTPPFQAVERGIRVEWFGKS